MTTKDKKAFDANNYKVVKKVSIPLLAKKDNTAIFVLLAGLAYVDKLKSTSRDAKPGDTVECNMLPVVNLESGESMKMVANHALLIDLEKTYPEGGYVNKAFRIVQHGGAGRSPRTYSVDEVEVG